MKEYNKQGIELDLQEIEELCPELLNLFHYFYEISNEYLESVEDLLPEEHLEIEYSKMDIKESISFVKEFLSTIDKKYLDIFDKSLNDGTFELFLPEDDLVDRPDYPITTPMPQASINIPVSNTIEDGVIIIHEFFHYLNDSEDIIRVRDIFTEMISIYFELRYYQFLINKGYDDIALNNEIYDRIDNSFDSANTLCFSSSSLDIYNNTGNINRKNIRFIDKYRNLYENHIKNINEFKDDDEFVDIINEFRENLSYVIGTLLAFFALREPKVYDVKIKYINDNINTMKIEELLKVLDTKITDYPIWIEECVKNLEKALGEINEEDNLYSGSHRSR